ncbi:hypothetical protein PoB_001927500 [Plakobranchus ocellatus]|uniref:Uncharacterized protein n=1 Tax=Plakobranchus ocellatus TaxID=259542 RepID=A0AAV3ZDX9_9GAST|nr:hypothetical protein PoB_001927500 [Plakobranchus ocellatus]
MFLYQVILHLYKKSDSFNLFCSKKQAALSPEYQFNVEFMTSSLQRYVSSPPRSHYGRQTAKVTGKPYICCIMGYNNVRLDSELAMRSSCCSCWQKILPNISTTPGAATEQQTPFLSLPLEKTGSLWLYSIPDLATRGALVFLSSVGADVKSLIDSTLRKADQVTATVPGQVAPASRGPGRLSGPASAQGAGDGARNRDRRVPADLRANSLATRPLTPQETVEVEEETGIRLTEPREILIPLRDRRPPPPPPPTLSRRQSRDDSRAISATSG